VAAGEAIRWSEGRCAFARGPRLSTRESFANVDVAPAFKLEGIQCGDLEKPRMFGAVCPAKSSLGVHFSNGILASSYRAQKVQITGQPFDDHKPSGTVVGLDVPDVVARAFAIAAATASSISTVSR
jgi:hypothetical protein